jgi:hypothetical protein
LIISLSHLPENTNTTHILLMAYHCDERGRGDKPCGWSWDGYIMAAQLLYPFDMTGQR